MKLFGRSGGYYLFWCSFIYLVTGLTCAVYYKLVPTEYIQIVWIFVLALPFLVPPIGRYFNMLVEWDIKMFDWFKSREERKQEYDNVVQFPGPVPYIEPPKSEETYYSIGVTSENRMTFKIGISTLTMNRKGCKELIEQLTVFMNQLPESTND